MDILENHEKMGAFALVVFGIGSKFYTMPWSNWRDMKAMFGHQYINQKDADPWRVRFNGAVLFFDFADGWALDQYAQEARREEKSRFFTDEEYQALYGKYLGKG